MIVCWNSRFSSRVPRAMLCSTSGVPSAKRRINMQELWAAVLNDRERRAQSGPDRHDTDVPGLRGYRADG